MCRNENQKKEARNSKLPSNSLFQKSQTRIPKEEIFSCIVQTTTALTRPTFILKEMRPPCDVIFLIVIDFKGFRIPGDVDHKRVIRSGHWQSTGLKTGSKVKFKQVVDKCKQA